MGLLLRTRRLATTGGFAVVLGAGILKSFDVAAFSMGLRQWSLLPTTLISPLAIAVPAAEIVTAGLGLFTSHIRFATKGVLGLLTLFTIALLTQYVFATPPKCECFGRIRLFDASQNEALWAAGRNALMIAVLLVSLRAERYASPVGNACHEIPNA